jgi:cold-inducible RNA-binding protein
MAPRREEIIMGNRLYVGNLSFNTSEENLLQTFGQFGGVEEAKIIMDRNTGRSKGFGFVTMESETSAQEALSKLNGTDLDGRTLRVSEAEERKERSPNRGGGRNRW